MITSHPGEFAALATACFWTITALAFEAAGKRVGSLVVNIVRLAVGFVLLSIFTFVGRRMLLPLDASAHAWLWLGLSGIVGLVWGDFMLFKAFINIGARISMLIMSSVPPFTSLIGWLILRETLSLHDWIGMALTVAGISWVVLERGEGAGQVRLSHPLSGVLFAFAGALGQAVGLVLSKHGMGDYDAFASTQIRLMAGLVGFAVIFTVLGRWRRVTEAFRDGRAMLNINLGAVFRPFLGGSFSLLAIQYTEAAVAATIMSIVPILIIAPSAVLFSERITLREVAGAFIAVGGVAILFM